MPGNVAILERARLEPARARAVEPARPVRSVRRTVLPFALCGSLALHLLPLALLVDWPVAPAETAPPIPVQFVIVPPKPPPPPPPARHEAKRPPPRETKRPAPGRLASENLGSPTGRRSGTAGGEAPEAKPHPAPPVPHPTPPVPHPTPPAAAALVSHLPPPKPAAVALPTPSGETEVAMLPPPPPQPPAPRPQRPARPMPYVEHLAGSWPVAPAHLGAPGPAATQDAYLAYCNTLIKRHFNMLPPSFIAGRRGLTVLSLVVLDDGRIARISVVRSSGYDDIDERVEKMIAAVGRFPPLPQWYQGQQVKLLYDLPIPNGLAR